MNQALKNNPLLAQLKASIEEQKSRVTGTVQGSRKSFGFLLDEQGNRHFIAPSVMQKLLPGDEVRAVLESENEREHAVVEEVLSSSIADFYGVVRVRSHGLWVEPESALMPNWMRLDADSDLEDGDWIKAILISHPFKSGKGRARLLKKIANSKDSSLPWKLAIDRYGIHTSPDLSEEVTANDEGYQDWTSIPFVTIDSESTLDVDDAVHAKITDEGLYALTVAIADPASLVRENDTCDQEALKRGTTTYLPGVSHSMLPRQLSEDFCSLLENRVRRSLVCQMVIDLDGNIISRQFSSALICSHAKLSYSGVEQYLNGETNLNRNEPIRDIVRALHECTTALRLNRERHAVLGQYGDDIRFIVHNHELAAIVRQPRNVAHFLIEECMVAANRSFAAYCLEKNIPCVYRVQPGYSEKMKSKAQEILEHWALIEPQDDISDLDVFSKVARALDRPENLIPSILLRTMMDKAIFSLTPGVHMGLGLESYATFTSPIRKYSDLINHRLMKAHLRNEDISSPEASLLAHLDERTTAANKASRDVQKALYARHFEANNVFAFSGQIVGITTGGIRIEEAQTAAQVFVPMKEISGRNQNTEIQAFGSELWVDGDCRYKIGDEVSFGVRSVEPMSNSIDGFLHASPPNGVVAAS